MTGFHRLFVSKVLAVILSFLLLNGSVLGNHPESDVLKGARADFDTALKEYQNGLYKQASAKLETVLNLVEADYPQFIAQVNLLLGACYEKLGNRDKARGHYLALRRMIDDGSIAQIPDVAGVDQGTLKVFLEVFDKSYFKFKKPIPVSEMLEKNVVHAPKKSIEAKEKEKKKKKIPLLIVVGAVVLIGTAAVLLFTQLVHKEKKEEASTLPNFSWIHVEAGEFLLGDNFNEGEGDELPVHKVYLDEFWISRYEVDNRDYITFCEDTGRKYSSPYGSSYPVVNVTWHDAKAFCDWLSEKKGEKINLPTEAQWEKAARGNDQYRYPWGNNSATCYYANFFGCGNSIDQPGNLVPVYTNSAGVSFYSVYNMAGNASEWCRDWYSSSYYSVSPTKNPEGPLDGSFRVVRGGDITSRAFDLRSANRDFKAPDYKGEELGFRIIKE